MPLKKFKEYSMSYSKDPKTFEKRVIFACTEANEIDLFQTVTDPLDKKLSVSEAPIIIWNNFNYLRTGVNESRSQVFNAKPLPENEEIYESFKEEEFIPKTISDRNGVKKLKFPILALGKENEEFKTYGKFKKSEKKFSKFREKIVPTSRFDVIGFKNSPIHLQEKQNSIGFDVDLNTFRYVDQVEKIINHLSENHSLDFFHLSLLELNGKIYFDKIDTSLNLSPTQSIKMYETAYEDHYVSRLPAWFKKEVFEKHIKPYYQKRVLDAALIKPKYAIDFKKTLDLA